MNITAGYPPTNRKIDTGKALKWWPVFVDHFSKTKFRGDYSYTVLADKAYSGGEIRACLDGT